MIRSSHRRRIAACLLALAAPLATPARAEVDAPRVYAYGGVANYCPAGLQPVTINGVICCGTPNQGITYQQAKSHPHPVVRRHVHRVARPVGIPLKGNDVYVPTRRGID